MNLLLFSLRQMPACLPVHVPTLDTGYLFSCLLMLTCDCAGSGYGNSRNQSRGIIFAYAVIAGINSALVSMMAY